MTILNSFYCCSDQSERIGGFAGKYLTRQLPPQAYLCATTGHGLGTSLLRATFADVRIDYLVEGLTCEIDLVLGRCVASRLFDAPRRFAVCAYSAIQWTIGSMSLHHWLGWLAFYLAWLWLGQTLQRPLPEPVAIVAFDDGYLIPRERMLVLGSERRGGRPYTSSTRPSRTRAAALLR